jgi:hypothetical protein
LSSYKIDRLTRSLADFSKMVEVFERRGVSFVSVTQQFNTTTSMGRLMLNVLLSFAQFEREVTGERIRDKIAASSAKVCGWAECRRWAMTWKIDGWCQIHRKQNLSGRFFSGLWNWFKYKTGRELRLDGATSKAWTTQDGKVRDGKPIDKVSSTRCWSIAPTWVRSATNQPGTLASTSTD